MVFFLIKFLLLLLALIILVSGLYAWHLYAQAKIAGEEAEKVEVEVKQDTDWRDF